MKKIALFSCHHDPNYGSMLQAYALAAVINDMGKEAEYINYSTLPDPYTLKRMIGESLDGRYILFGKWSNHKSPKVNLTSSTVRILRKPC